LITQPDHYYDNASVRRNFQEEEPFSVHVY
jgi:hypothetical protein